MICFDDSVVFSVEARMPVERWRMAVPLSVDADPETSRPLRDNWGFSG
jgi:hypothetical protein